MARGALVAVAVLVAGCGGDPEGTTSPTSPSEATTDDAAPARGSSEAATTTEPFEVGDIDTEYRGDGPTVAVLGDSLTVQSWDELVDALDGYAVRIAAIRGEGLSGGPFSREMGQAMMPAQVREMALDPPDVVVVGLGTNDVWGSDLSVDGFRATWAELVTAVAGSCLVGITVTEEAPAAVPPYDGAAAAAVNSLIRADSDVVVDWATEGLGDRYTDATDTIHLTDDGQRHRAALVREAVDRCPATGTG
jgi:lysophospholipase L1-like esterase